MRLVRLDNLNEMWELKKSYGENFIGVLNSYLFYVINNGNIVEINREKVAKMLKMTSLDQLRLVIAAMYFEENESVNESPEKATKQNKKENAK